MNTSEFPIDNEPPSDDLLAAEYVVGVLDASARAAVEARAAGEPAFAALIDAWERRLAPLLADIPEAAVPAHVWPRIRTQLGWPAVESARRGVWNSVGFWRGAAASSMAVAAALAVVALRTPDVGPAQPRTTPVATVPAVEPEDQTRQVVVLEREGGTAAWLAAIDPGRDAITMTPVPAPAAGDGRVGELWLIPTGGAPRSLGFVSNEVSHTVQVPAELQRELAVGAVLAITLEPEQGIPHAAPTGPIVASGNIRSI